MLGERTLVYDNSRSEPVFPRVGIVNETNLDGVVGITILGAATRDCSTDSLPPAESVRRVMVFTRAQERARALAASRRGEAMPLPEIFCTDPSLPMQEQRELFADLIGATGDVRAAIVSGRAAIVAKPNVTQPTARTERDPDAGGGADAPSATPQKAGPANPAASAAAAKAPGETEKKRPEPVRRGGTKSAAAASA